MKKIIYLIFFLSIYFLINSAMGLIKGVKIRFDSDANASYVNTFPQPIIWDTSLTEGKRLYIIELDTTTLSTNVIIHWQTLSNSGKAKSDTFVITKDEYITWDEQDKFRYLAEHLNLALLE